MRDEGKKDEELTKSITRGTDALRAVNRVHEVPVRKVDAHRSTIQQSNWKSLARHPRRSYRQVNGLAGCPIHDVDGLNGDSPEERFL